MSNKQSSVDKEFVPYKEALALKELGFNEPCYKYIYIGDTGINVDHYLEVEPSKARNYNADSLSISQPTFSQAFRWFREKYSELDFGFAKIHNETNNYHYHIQFVWEFFEGTYEEAELACLRKLIEIVQGGNNEQQ